MSDLQKMRCPICGTAAPRRISDTMLQCTLCRMTDSQAAFDKPAPVAAMSKEPLLFQAEETYPIKDGQEVRMHFPPDEVYSALAVIENYFKSRTNGPWMLGPIQSRDFTGVPANACIEDVRRLAAAFRCLVLPRPTRESIAPLVNDVSVLLHGEIDAFDAGEQAKAKNVVSLILTGIGVP